jgi:hypothetical protein
VILLTQCDGGFMADDDQLKKLELRITELETQLQAAQAPRQATQLTSEELQAFVKVRDVLASDFGDFCGINDCFRCRVLPCQIGGCVGPRPCVVECTCGPCNLGGSFGAANLGRFSGLGG